MKSDLRKRAERLLAMHGYAVQELHGCCDLIAKKGNRLVVLKVLADANALSIGHAAELRQFAGSLSATPLVIAERAGAALESGIAAMRHGLFTLSLPTFGAALDTQPLFFLRNSAGVTAGIEGQKLKTARESAGMSLPEFAAQLGVSRSMAVQYESATAHITAQRAVQLAERFGQEVLARLELFAPMTFHNSASHSPVSQKYHSWGFAATEAHKLPFDVIARRDEEIILTEVGDRFRKGLSPLSQFLDADPLVIFDHHRPRDVPALQREEFFEMRGAKELIKFVKTY